MTNDIQTSFSSFRASSRKTRIETDILCEDKSGAGLAFRASSRKTRIETPFYHPYWFLCGIFQSVIQKNKD